MVPLLPRSPLLPSSPTASAAPQALLPGRPTGMRMQRFSLRHGGLLLFSVSLFGVPMTGFHLNQMQALNRELGKLCHEPPRQALNVCRLHAQLLRSL